MELRTLRSFVALARHGHFTRTAADIGVAQPALSKHIQALEDELGVRLFDRTPREVRLSRAGQRLLAPARAVLAAVDQVADTAAQIRAGTGGTLRVGVTPTAPASLLAPVMARYRQAHRTIACRVTQASSEDLLRALVRGTLDAALVRVEVAEGRPDLTCVPVFADRLCVAVLKAHPLARRRHVRWRQLADATLLLVRREAAPVVHDRIVSACRAAGFTPASVHDLQDAHAAIAFADAGLGVAVVPASTMHPRSVVLRPLAEPAITTRLGIAYASAGDDTDVRDFVQLVRALALQKI